MLRRKRSDVDFSTLLNRWLFKVSVEDFHFNLQNTFVKPTLNYCLIRSPSRILSINREDKIVALLSFHL